MKTRIAIVGVVVLLIAGMMFLRGRSQYAARQAAITAENQKEMAKVRDMTHVTLNEMAWLAQFDPTTQIMAQDLQMRYDILNGSVADMFKYKKLVKKTHDQFKRGRSSPRRQLMEEKFTFLSTMVDFNLAELMRKEQIESGQAE